MFSFLKRPVLPAVHQRHVAFVQPTTRFAAWANKISKRDGGPRYDPSADTTIALLIPEFEDAREAVSWVLKVHGPVLLLEFFSGWASDEVDWPSPTSIVLIDWLRIDVCSQVFDAGSGKLKIDRSQDLCAEWADWLAGDG